MPAKKKTIAPYQETKGKKYMNNVRGGIYTTVAAEHRQAGWNPPAPVAQP